MYPGQDPANLTESQKQTVSALSQIAAGLAGGLASGSTLGAGTGAVAGKNAVENNYLSSSEKSLQTYLNLKQNLTPEEKQERDALNRKDAETSQALINACLGGADSACTAARQDALDKQATYQNPKEAQAGFQQIQALLDGTSPEARQTQQLYNGMVASYVRMGMSEEAAKTAVGYQLGAIYISGGLTGIGSGKAIDTGLMPGVKASASPSSAEETAGSIKNVNPGNPASALPINSTKGVPLSVLEQQYGSKFQYVSSSDMITQQMDSAGSGARGIVFGSYGAGQPGHVFNVVNQNGTVRYLDGQTGKPADLSQFQSFQLLRTN
nr:VENN motif pre-toxin domain-containing protein [Pantoea cypripedii]